MPAGKAQSTLLQPSPGEVPVGESRDRLKPALSRASQETSLVRDDTLAAYTWHLLVKFSFHSFEKQKTKQTPPVSEH